LKKSLFSQREIEEMMDNKVREKLKEIDAATGTEKEENR